MHRFRERPLCAVNGAGALALALMLTTLAACTAPQTRQLLAATGTLPPAVELTETPFFPQQAYQCGPAALATVLASAGVPVTPAHLTPQVYLPARHGSLQLELLAAARSHARVPYVLRPELAALVQELSAGNPVLVLQNLGLSLAPAWHYAVVVGFDPATRVLILRSGTERRRIMRLSTFERTWRRSNHWAAVVTTPGRLPATAEELPYLTSVLGLEQVAQWNGAAAAYSSALERWPQSLGALMGLGNSRYALGDLSGAEEAFRAATRHHPRAGVAFNNLAQVLADQGRVVEAVRAARQAVETGGEHTWVFRQTLESIQARERETPAH